MNIVGKILTACADILFPRDAHVLIFDTIDICAIERLATHPVTHTPITCLAPFPYRHKLIRSAIQATKYHGHRRAPSLLGEVLAPHIAEELSDRRMFGTFLEPLLIPIPLHSKRLRERGFNQTERIAEALIKTLSDENITIDTTSLVRVKNTKHQTLQHKREERAKNLQNAFSVKDLECIRGKDILLFDDVLTTGATLSSAKRTLQKAGVRNVLCIAVAH